MCGASPASSPASSTSSKPQSGRHQSQRAEHYSQERERGHDGKRDGVLRSQAKPQSDKEKEKAHDALLLESARICTVFAQATTVIEQFKLRDDGGSISESKQSSRGKSRQKEDNEEEARLDVLTKRVGEAASFLPRCRALLSVSLHETEGEIQKLPNGAADGNGGEGEKGRAQTKVGRALERLRRVAVKLVDATSAARGKVLERGGNGDVMCVKKLLNDIVGFYEGSSEVSAAQLSKLFIIFG
jgi:hypothetical protein